MAENNEQEEVGSQAEHKPGFKGPLSQELFDKVADRHKNFITRMFAGGKLADLSGYDLRGLSVPHAVSLLSAPLNLCNLRGQSLLAPNLSEASMIEADLSEATILPHRTEARELGEAKVVIETPSFKKASLIGTRFDGADIRQADFTGADFAGATLFNATLKDCNFRTAVNLIPSQMAGADLSGAKLPDHVDWAPTLSWVENLSKDARKLSVALLVACVFAWLMLFQVTDAQLILNNSSLSLPLVNSGVSVIGFFIGMSVLLACLFLYLLVNLQRNWEVLATLPAFFQDGKPFYRRVFPWMPNGIIARYLALQRDQLPPFHLSQTILSYVMLYAIVPVTMVGLWVRYFPRHDWPVTLFLSLVLAAVLFFAVLFWIIARRTLQGRRRNPFSWNKCWRDKRLYVAILCTSIVTVATVGITHLCINSDPQSHLIGRNLAALGVSPSANLYAAHLSTRPEPWMNTEDQLQQVIGAQLAGRDLRWAYAHSAFLVKADLMGADLSHADLSFTDLRHAILDSSTLFGSDLTSALLDNAHLIGADLTDARLVKASLKGADLTEAHFDGATLRFADLTNAYLAFADLNGAVLKRAQLDGADFKHASLNGTNLMDVDLRGAKNLTRDQVNMARVYSTTKLPAYLAEDSLTSNQ